jgi:hypothetical protein
MAQENPTPPALAIVHSRSLSTHSGGFFFANLKRAGAPKSVARANPATVLTLSNIAMSLGGL